MPFKFHVELKPDWKLAGSVVENTIKCHTWPLLLLPWSSQSIRVMGRLLLAFLAVAWWRERKGGGQWGACLEECLYDKGVKERGFECLTGKAFPFSHSWWEETGPLVFSLAGQLSLTLVGWSLSGSGLTFEVLLWAVNRCEVVRNFVQHVMQCFSSNDLSTYFSWMPNNSTTKAVECNRWGSSVVPHIQPCKLTLMQVVS